MTVHIVDEDIFENKYGDVLFFDIVLNKHRPEIVACFATKDHWQYPSQLDWIRTGCANLHRGLLRLGQWGVRLPWLGCGFGGLKQEDVEKIIREEFESSSINVTICQKRR